MVYLHLVDGRLLLIYLWFMGIHPLAPALQQPPWIPSYITTNNIPSSSQRWKSFCSTPVQSGKCQHVSPFNGDFHHFWRFLKATISTMCFASPPFLVGEITMFTPQSHAEAPCIDVNWDYAGDIQMPLGWWELHRLPSGELTSTLKITIC